MAVMKYPAIAAAIPRIAPASAVQAEYRPLHKYLRDRYADTVTLTFAEIEDLLGVPLPRLAREGEEWWRDAEADGSRTAQSQTWMEAGRAARPNMSAKTVVFTREQIR